MKKIQWKNKYIFIILYAIGFLGVGIIGFFSTSYFAYEEFNSLAADVLYLVFLSLLLVTALVQDLIYRKSITDKIISIFTFGGGLAIFILLIIFGGVLNLIAVVYSAALFVVFACRLVLIMRNGEKPDKWIKELLCIAFLILFPTARLIRVEFVSEIYMLWGLIPAVAISAVLIPIGFVLLHKVWRQFYPKESSSVGNAICVCVLVFFASFFYSFVTIGTVNYVFDNSPTPTEYVILEKRINSGGLHSPTEFEVKVEIDGEEKWIDLPVTDYHTIAEGDTVIVDYYKGALGFGFYEYNSIG